jgi:predicted Ser/Thr protein kinase
MKLAELRGSEMRQWPSAQDYNEAVQIAELAFEDPALAASQPELNTMGLPRAISGNFASVYKMIRGEKALAVKCFLRNIYNQHQTYQQLSVGLRPLSCVTDFEYLLKGIFTLDDWYPVVRMDWLEGLTLDHLVRKNLHNRKELDRFIEQFVKITRELRENGIAHGDLQHGNLIVRKEDVMIVDYDGMFVPSMKGESSRELGHANFQHPQRTANHFDARIDNFSAWIIYHSILLIRSDPGLWQRNGGGDDCLLFRKHDFENPSASRLMSELDRHPVPDVKDRARVLHKLFECSYDQVPDFDPANESFTGKTVNISVAASVPAEDAKYPSIDDYLAALRNHPRAFTDPALQKGVQECAPIIRRHGITVKLSCYDKTYAVKCFLAHDPHRKQRFEAISKHNMGPAGKHLLSFQYQSKGIEIDGQFFPMLRMSWFSGNRLDNYVRSLLEDSSRGKLHEVVETFRDMMNALTLGGIAHGDLEPGNILVDSSGKMRLIDYDCMYELGTAPYTHPSRKHDHFGPYLDNYSATVIDGVLTYLATLPPANRWNWTQLLQDTSQSTGLLRSAQDHPGAHLSRMIKEIRKYRIDQVPPLKASYRI